MRRANKDKPIPTSEQLSALFEYDTHHGVLRWKARYENAQWDARWAGKIAGSVRHDGYVKVKIFGGRFLAHRVIWAMAHGEWPTRILDHINRNPSDNRICNLREVTPQENGWNKLPALTGVSFLKTSGRWRARICANGHTMHLGDFPSPEEARAAYRSAKSVHHVIRN